MIDETEPFRRIMQTIINLMAANRDELESIYGKVWNTSELQNDFDVLGFVAPFVVVVRRSDGKLGSLIFQHNPRYYFYWEEVG